ncbi:UNVERIFIED_CONTAM: Retrovirus-related Pol polyprotein from transposon TNT 1-94 [Sesamum calycinum]|uniref:Retrovirus-related Pol polyprotein from transposon TNT 1-94 n=1 Tax=Sesamum calycinum TaxID=2727403 RepID=A0AAW2MBF6_9LAMI
MMAEIGALEENNTWKLVPLPAGKRPIGCKWVFKMKLRADGTVERYKARLVAKVFNQVEAIDYVDNFSPVAKTVIVRLFLAFAAAQVWPLQQLDVNNAFLHGHLDEDLFMIPPEGFSVAPGLVCKPSLDEIQNLKSYLHKLFTIKDIGDARYFLALEIARSYSGIYVTSCEDSFNSSSFKS